MSTPFNFVNTESLYFKHVLEKKLKDLFPNWKPKKSQWQILSKNDNVSPKMKISAPFKVVKDESHTNTNWIQLKYCEGKFIYDDLNSGIIFTGGPVKTSCWCPTPNPNDTQYLALCTSNSFDKLSYACAETRTGLLQLWNFGCLDRIRFECDPKLEFLVNQNHGEIIDMAWCPKGCWEPPVAHCSPDDISRLGLLAIAFSDSYIRIYCIPHPKFLNSPSENPVFSTSSLIKLDSLSGQTHHQKYSFCCLSWQKTDECERIAAGFSNGMVLVWMVNSTSTLHACHEFHKTVYPYLAFPAHGTPLASLTFVPMSGNNFLATSSLDKILKLWNLSDTTLPIAAKKSGFSIDAQWAIHCYDFLSEKYEISSYRKKKKVLRKRNKDFDIFNELGDELHTCQNAYESLPAVIGSSTSELLNALALADSKGSVYVNMMAMWKDKRPLFKNYKIFETDLVDMDDTSLKNFCHHSRDCSSSDIFDKHLEYDNISENSLLFFLNGPQDPLESHFTDKKKILCTSENKDIIKIPYKSCTMDQYFDALKSKSAINDEENIIQVVSSVLSTIIKCVQFNANVCSMPDYAVEKSMRENQFDTFDLLSEVASFQSSAIDAENGKVSNASIVLSSSSQNYESSIDENSTTSFNNAFPSSDSFFQQGLIFRDSDLRIQDGLSFSIASEDCLSIYPELLAMTSISWNPNPGSHSWVFCAGQSGIGRLICLSELTSSL